MAAIAGSLAVGALVTGCAGGDLVLPEEGVPRQIAVVAGDEQSGTAGGLLPEALVVRVSDAIGRPVANVQIAGSTADGGQIVPGTVRTNADGRAEIRWILGPLAGPQSAEVRVDDAVAPEELVASFTATAAAAQGGRLEVVRQPSASAVSGVVFAQQPVVRVVDATGNAVAQEGITVVAALAAGAGTLGGAASRQTDDEGVATFTDLRIDGADGVYTLIFSAPGLQSVVSADIQVGSGGGGGGGGGSTATVTAIASHTPDPSDQGRAVLFDVDVRPAPGGSTPPGNFRVTASTGEFCDGLTAKRTCEIIFNSPGSRTITAAYLGSGSFDPSTSAPVTHVVNAVVGATRTIIGTGPDPSSVGQPVTVFITVKGTGGIAAFGRVIVYGSDSRRCGDGQILGYTDLDHKGEGRVTVTNLPAGLHVLRGCYAGAPGFAPSEDLATQTVQ